MMRKRARFAFTLIEALFAIFMIATAAGIVAATMPVADISRAKASMQDKAMSLAQKQLEAIRGLGYANATPAQLYSSGLIDSSSPISANTYSFTNSDSANLDNPSLVLPSGSGTVNLQQVSLDLVQVTITVSWSDRGDPKSFTVGTLIANI